jgi:hypothetical protein
MVKTTAKILFALMEKTMIRHFGEGMLVGLVSCATEEGCLAVFCF